MKTAFITGVTGQDGAYLAALLISKGYRVIGGYRRSSNQTFWRLAELNTLAHPSFCLVEHDLTDPHSSFAVLSTYQPDEVYNLAAQSYVTASFSQPSATAQISGLGAQTLLEAVRLSRREIRVYQASSAEMFGKVRASPQDELTPFHPRSPYGVAKLFAHWSAVNHREAYEMFVASGILFNHESPLRGEEFVTRKIAKAACRISLGAQARLRLGNLHAKRDWGFAGDYVEGMWRMLQAPKPDTFVLATGTTTSVREFADLAFLNAGMELIWRGRGADEVGVCATSGRTVVEVDPALYRPAEVDVLIGRPNKAERELGWRPQIKVAELAKMMVAAEFHWVGARPGLLPEASTPPIRSPATALTA